MSAKEPHQSQRHPYYDSMQTKAQPEGFQKGCSKTALGRASDPPRQAPTSHELYPDKTNTTPSKVVTTSDPAPASANQPSLPLHPSLQQSSPNSYMIVSQPQSFPAFLPPLTSPHPCTHSAARAAGLLALLPREVPEEPWLGEEGTHQGDLQERVIGTDHLRDRLEVFKASAGLHHLESIAFVIIRIILYMNLKNLK